MIADVRLVTTPALRHNIVLFCNETKRDRMSATPIDRLLAIMAQLRNPDGGCPWDLEQDFSSIVPYTIEEAYEVADAIERDDMDDLRDELGDLLLQVVFHAQMAREVGLFDFADIATSISDKMVRRHPHVFGDKRFTDADEQTRNWEQIKAEERAGKAAAADNSQLAGVGRGLVPWLRAIKLQQQAARVGFDWPDVAGAVTKLGEEIDELKTELGQEIDRDRAEDELGDVLFCLLNIARKAKLDPDRALRRVNDKFERRFRAMERQALEAQQSLENLSLVEQDALWEAAKDLEQARRNP